MSILSVRTQGNCTYLLRDQAYAQDISAFGWGQEPLVGYGGLTGYERGNAYIRNAAAPYTQTGTFNPAAPATDRTYFRPPIL